MTIASGSNKMATCARPVVGVAALTIGVPMRWATASNEGASSRSVRSAFALGESTGPARLQSKSIRVVRTNVLADRRPCPRPAGSQGSAGGFIPLFPGVLSSPRIKTTSTCRSSREGANGRRHSRLRRRTTRRLDVVQEVHPWERRSGPLNLGPVWPDSDQHRRSTLPSG